MLSIIGIFAINRDGTAHNKSAGKTIPSSIFNILEQKFPDFKFPSNRLVQDMQNKIICESIDKNNIK